MIGRPKLEGVANNSTCLQRSGDFLASRTQQPAPSSEQEMPVPPASLEPKSSTYNSESHLGIHVPAVHAPVTQHANSPPPPPTHTGNSWPWERIASARGGGVVRCDARGGKWMAGSRVLKAATGLNAPPTCWEGKVESGRGGGGET